MNYKELNIRPTDRIEVAFRKIVRYFIPDVSAGVIAKVADLVMKDKEYRPRMLRIIMTALDGEAQEVKSL